jgi:uncharacterized protein (DUF1501 family)
MTWDPSRRVFLRGAGLAALGVGFHPSSLLVRTAQAAGLGPRALVQVFIRGGLDGLSVAVPYGEPEYYSLRGAIALPRPGSAGGVVGLDGTFGLHPGLASLKPLWDDGRLAIVPAVGNYGLTRSHFDAQDFMETGTPGERTTATGWLDRTIRALPGSTVTEAVAFQSQLPRSFLGPEPVLVAQTLTSFDIRARNWRAEAESLLRAMYANGTSDVYRVGRETLDAVQALLTMPTLSSAPANGAAYPDGAVGAGLRQTAQIVRGGLGTRCFFVSVSGQFDTHSGQLASHELELTRIGSALAAFAQDLGVLLDDVVVLVSTEFGRTAAVNGALGTDHGAAHCSLVMGGGVRGGRILGGWPGLSAGRLHEGRELAVTTDYRDLFAEIARKHLGVDTAQLFPGYTPGPGPGVLA